ncbi:MAG: energy transducer TonB, partial [Acidobacteriota bacterium]
PSIVPATVPIVPVSPAATENPSNPVGGGSGNRRGSGSVGTEGGSDTGVGDAPAVTAAPDAVGPLLVQGEVKAPVVIHRVQPEFPEIARRAHKGGVVRVLCIIDKTGAVVNARVVSSTFAAFDQPALDAVQQWRFVPGSLRGHSVDTFFELTVTFSLR